jgi:acylglycerol lipase
MIAVNRMPAKLLPLLLLAACGLAGCMAIPFGVPRGRPGYPIVTSGYFTVEGGRLPYRLYPAQGKLRAVVLALHGYTDSRDGWRMLAAVLNPAGIAIYAPDQSSFGATGNRGYWPGTDVLVAQARAMAVQLRAQYPGRKLVLMGESMGGAIGILLGASAEPPPVDAYVLSAPAVWGGAALNPVYRGALAMADAVAPAKRMTGGVAHVTASDNRAALIDFGRDPLSILAPRLDNVAGLVGLMGAAQAACGRFDQPALILYGGHDEIIPAAAMKSCWEAMPERVTLAYYLADYHLIERDNERAVPDADIAGFILGTGVVSGAPSAATVWLAGP